MFDSKGLVKMYAPNGAEVYLPFDPANAARLLALYEQQGLSPVPLTEYERERRDMVGAFVVRSHINGDGSETPVVDVYFRHRNGYTDRLRSMRVYLNTERDRARFEAAFGVSLDALDIYDGDTPIERGKRPQQERFIYEPNHPVWVVWRLNPASESDEQAPKRLFVRWETAGRQQSRQRPQEGGQRKQGNGPQDGSQGRQSQQQQQQGNGHDQKSRQPVHDEKQDQQTQDEDEKRYHFSQWPVLAAIAREWGMPAGEVVKRLYAIFGKTGKRMTVAEAVAWAKANRPPTLAA